MPRIKETRAKPPQKRPRGAISAILKREARSRVTRAETENSFENKLAILLRIEPGSDNARQAADACLALRKSYLQPQLWQPQPPLKRHRGRPPVRWDILMQVAVFIFEDYGNRRVRAYRNGPFAAFLRLVFQIEDVQPLIRKFLRWRQAQ